ncbi:DNA-directed RNA polymerase subunit alpha [candidate division WOR-1 bacterium RIFOXYA2_FULL_36_21]|uniref:DNA-directed RNA polymerase subunit alpha n=1 Tax=candidate division WOR-1 bacterium RIFOXYB2_FULL_36_35 TaxID=1802578 RepID=A0A1F4S568_UNCSA|nr:MAG: DNA-directed RNA polymerase subunit alpha [candidate division WOR-1 bacterium RIFOXYA2_FULL_36_21]OGC15550.1 MAG: DNA-directed RNA polymerase subunit alpha [candidate division WOR-1 bacterium RIFOXYB2_FULL_36_35]OGC21328.1 MAG: DNA-directed RNA polymerase subunit alpha [candidate division WOR-1 bacterium RIFOXYA12_FULL_36_13]
MMLGDKPWVRYEEESDTYGRFVVEPLDRGYGATLGNAMRRVLLSSLTGAAITSMRIDGISHEFATVEGVVEDVLQIILNLKEVRFRSHSDTPKVVTLKTKKKGVLTAGEIEHDAEIEIINPDKVIATLDSNVNFDMEMIVERGKGYVPQERNKKATLPVGAIPIDSIFTPVLKVNMVIEEVRVGQEIDHDRLVLHVWTDGTIKPDDAVRESAKILSKHIDLFVNLGEPMEVSAGAAEKTEEVETSILEMSLEDLELSARSLNCLKRANINTVGELISFSEEELMKFKNFGGKSLLEVKEKLAEYKLSFKGASDEAQI